MGFDPDAEPFGLALETGGPSNELGRIADLQAIGVHDDVVVRWLFVLDRVEAAEVVRARPIRVTDRLDCRCSIEPSRCRYPLGSNCRRRSDVDTEYIRHASEDEGGPVRGDDNVALAGEFLDDVDDQALENVVALGRRWLRKS